MNSRFRLYTLCLWVVLLLGINPARAQWLTQNFDLKAGWNAVFLEVDPAQPEPGPQPCQQEAQDYARSHAVRVRERHVGPIPNGRRGYRTSLDAT